MIKKDIKIALYEGNSFWIYYKFPLKRLKNIFNDIDHINNEINEIIIKGNLKNNTKPVYLKYFTFSNILEYIKNNTTYILGKQENALEKFFNHKVCNIKGPPGTGKTFTGALIIEILVNYIFKVIESKNI